MDKENRKGLSIWRLKAGEKIGEIPVIFMTALTATEDKVTGQAAGFDLKLETMNRRLIQVSILQEEKI